MRYIIGSRKLGFSVLVGSWDAVARHRHYAMHLLLAVDEPLRLVVAENVLQSRYACAIGMQVPHELPAHRLGMVLSFSPMTGLGLFVRALLDGSTRSGHDGALRPRRHGKGWLEIDHPSLDEMRRAARGLAAGAFSPRECAMRLEYALEGLVADPFRAQLDTIDSRIRRALGRIFADPAHLVPAATLASELALSESRFLHLFKAELGITYRRMEIWMRLAASVRMLGTVPSLTEIAHEAGFADSAHFSRSFKETFGVLPSRYIKDSSFVQV